MNRLLILLGLAVGGQTLLAANEQITTKWGHATIEGDKTAYWEKHTIARSNGKLLNTTTEYFENDKKTKIAEMKSDYSESVSLPTYEFVDFRRKYKEGVELVGDKYFAYYQKQGEEEQRKQVKTGSSVFSCQGWHYYLIDNLEKLENSDLVLNLILPSELDHYAFDVQKVKSNGDRISAKLELSNWLLSFFAPQLNLVYDKKAKQLISYQGISNILDKNGERQEVSITYSDSDTREAK